MYSNSCCSCSFEPEIIKIGQSSHKMYSNNIVNFQESTTILNAYTKKSGNLLNAPHIFFEKVCIYPTLPPWAECDHQVWIQSFSSSPRLVVLPKLKKSSLSYYLVKSWSKNWWVHGFSKHEVKHQHLHPGFKLGLMIPFPMVITITLNTPPMHPLFSFSRPINK